MPTIRSKPPFVYFVRRADGEGPVKIGCSAWPTERLSALMCWSPYELEIVATWPGDEDVERQFHALFTHLHSHREWFKPAPELQDVIEAVRAGTFDPVILPPPQRIRYPRHYPDDVRRGVGDSIRLNAMKRWGYPIPCEIDRANGSRYGTTPDAAKQMRAAVREFIEAYYEAACALRDAKKAAA
jgi:hypothetical protein